jgi:hypothetical protein
MEDDGNEEYDGGGYYDDDNNEGGDTSGSDRGITTPYTEEGDAEGDAEPMQSNLFAKSGRDDSTHNTSTRDSEYSDDDDDEDDDDFSKNKSGYRGSKKKRKASTHGDMSDTLRPYLTLIHANPHVSHSTTLTLLP